MALFEFIFNLGVVVIIFTTAWKLIATIFTNLLQAIGIHKDYTFLIFKSLSYYILVSITALITAEQMQNSNYTFATILYAIAGTFVIYATIAGNLERNRWRAVLNYERKRIRVMRFDGYLLMACIVLFISTLIKPEIAEQPMHLWIRNTIDQIYNTPVLKFFIGFFAFFYMINMIIRGIKATDQVMDMILNRKKTDTGIPFNPNKPDSGYTDYEVVDEVQEPPSQLR